MFDSYGGNSDAKGGPGFSVFWRGGEAEYEAWRFDKERPWAIHETPVSGERDGDETPDPPPEEVELAREQVAQMFEGLTDKQRFVLKLKWGLDGHRRYSFREIASMMGVRWQAVQGTYNRALATLRKRHAS
jgi:DNA-directed RNA polymerase specialized sigma24 family protein